MKRKYEETLRSTGVVLLSGISESSIPSSRHYASTSRLSHPASTRVSDHGSYKILSEYTVEGMSETILLLHLLKLQLKNKLELAKARKVLHPNTGQPPN